jgi:diguanylate cyclase (GGDEF)-like protein
MTWSRRLTAAFWTVFLWTFLIHGPSPSLEPIEEVRTSELISTMLLILPAACTAITAIILRRMSRYIDRQVKALAYNDALTGLPNRAFLMQRLDEAVSRGARGDQMIAVMFLDLDRFKVINDSLGHFVGDEALLQVAHRLLACTKPGDTLARFGGDEFVILRENVEIAADVSQLAQDLISSLSAPLRVAAQELYVSVSVGIALSRPRDIDTTHLLRRADLALYQAKAQGKGCFVFCNEDMNSDAVHQLSIENDLRRASQRGELRVLYQPEFSVQTGELAGFEALLRWNHPVRGLLMPSEFIGIAEENGSLPEIGLWVLEAACWQLQKWRAANPGRRDLEMSVNLSARQLEQPNFPDQVVKVLDRTRVEPHLIRLEITETVLVQDGKTAATALTSLKKAGLKLAIDDFGTGYSSFNYLRHLPVDAIKIDQSFIRNICESESNTKIVQGIVTLAHELGLDVTAEGIETSEQIDRLREMKCDRAQGYYLARPLSSDVIDALFVGDRRMGPVVLAA